MAFDTTEFFSATPRYSRSNMGAYRAWVKSATDFALVCLLALPVGAVIAVLAALVMLDGGKPFYAQNRIGRGGKIFRMWKLRTMIPNADTALERHLAAHPQDRVEWDRSQKLKNDPRITRMGRLLRRSSLDELPQLWNVVIGDMSLIGPRPMMLDQKAMYPGNAYYDLKPGLSGYWQISARNETSFAERAVYDTLYYQDLSPTTDLFVMWRTVAVVLRGTGH